MSTLEPPPLPGAPPSEPSSASAGTKSPGPAAASAARAPEPEPFERDHRTSTPAPASGPARISPLPVRASTSLAHTPVERDRRTAARVPADIRAQVIDSEVIEMATPSAEHGNAQAGIVTRLRHLFHRRAGGELPGGWWLMTEVEIEFEPDQLFIPDVVGWRRSASSVPPTGRPMTTLPDWVCEVISPSTASADLVKKLRVYQRSAVRYYWTVDLVNETLTVLRWTPEGYLVTLTAGRSEEVRAEPFDAVEIPVAVLFGDDDDDHV
jgi:Uma2 family endonuclease